jgi:hypothetical protein
VNKKQHRTSIFLLTTIYSLVLIVGSVFYTSIEFSPEKSSSKENQYSNFSSKHVHLAFQSEKSAPTSSTSELNFKKIPLDFFTDYDFSELLFQIQLAQNKTHFNDFRIHFRKANLFFPFHNFW